MRKHIERVLIKARGEKSHFENELNVFCLSRASRRILKLQIALVKFNIFICETLLRK